MNVKMGGEKDNAVSAQASALVPASPKRGRKGYVKPFIDVTSEIAFLESARKRLHPAWTGPV